MGLQRHTFDHDRPGIVVRRSRDNTHLLDDVRPCRAEYGVLRCVGEDHPGKGTRCLCARRDAALSQTARNEPRHARLAPCPVHVNANRDAAEVAPVEQGLEEPQQDQDHEHEQQNGEPHALPPVRKLLTMPHRSVHCPLPVMT